MITGVSGAGKTQALHIMEDMGYYCIDNLPPVLIDTFLDLTSNNTSLNIDKLAIGIDIRSAKHFDNIRKITNDLQQDGVQCEILFLDAKDDIIVSRFKQTKRTHPLEQGLNLIEAIKEERDIIQPIKESATYIVDTTDFSIWQLKEKINSLFSEEGKDRKFPVNVVSFGFKNGTPNDADMIFDVRFITNPYYIPELKNKTGMDHEVSDFVMSTNEARVFFQKLIDMVDYLIPLYIMEGKGQLTIAIGCTGGHHRSVTIANELNKHLLKKGYGSQVEHRNIRA
jgi:UPF0042 nucleotide-binding protein